MDETGYIYEREREQNAATLSTLCSKNFAIYVARHKIIITGSPLLSSVYDLVEKADLALR